MIGRFHNAYNIETDEEDIHYSRFITHVKYFAERFYDGKMLNEESDQLFEQIANIYPKAMNGSFKVRDYLKQLHGVTIPNEELAYLAVHIHRLTTNMDLNKQ